MRLHDPKVRYGNERCHILGSVLEGGWIGWNKKSVSIARQDNGLNRQGNIGKLL